MSISATNTPNQHVYGGGSTIETVVYGTLGLVMWSPLILAAGLLYSMYAGVRLAAKKLTIYANKDQAYRLQVIFTTTLQLDVLQKKKNELIGFKKTAQETLGCERVKIAQAEKIETVHNPLIGMVEESSLLKEASLYIETAKDHAKRTKEISQAMCAKLMEKLEANEPLLTQTEKQLSASRETIQLQQDAYQAAGRLSKVAENVILWQPFFSNSSIASEFEREAALALVR